MVAVAVGGSLLALARVLGGAPPGWLTSARLAKDVAWILAVIVVVVVAATVLLVPHVAPR